MRSIAIVLAGLLLTTSAAAEDKQTNHLHVTETVLARLNPLGAADELRLDYRIVLHPGSTNKLLQETYLAPRIGFQVSPAAFRPIIGFESQPLRILTLYVGYEPAAYYGALRSLHSYDSPNADAATGFWVSGPPQNNATYAAVVHQFRAGVSLQAELHGVFAQSATRLNYESGNLRGDDRVYYDSGFDLLVAKKGWVFENDTDVGVSLSERVKVGVRYATLLTWFPSEAYQPGEPHTNPNSPVMRTGPIFQYEIKNREFGPFETASLFATANWFLEHRYRTGEAVSQAAPFLGGGVKVTGDL